MPESEYIESEPLWVSWLKRDPNFEQSFYETLELFERQAVEEGVGKSDATVARKYEATGAYLVIRRLRNYMTMHQREAQAHARREATRKTR